MKKFHLTSQQILWLCVFILGIGLVVADYMYVSHVYNNWIHYTNPGDIDEELEVISCDGPYTRTDPPLVYMLRSKEYQSANEDQKHNMRLVWAQEYRDKHIGRFTRLCVIYLSLLFGAAGTFFSGKD